MKRGDGARPEWRLSKVPVAYDEAVSAMQDRIADIRRGRAPELVWLLEHPPIYTAGTSARYGDLVDPGRFPVHRSGRGGEFTYHGPGQRVVYLMLDLTRRRQDLRAYVDALQRWIIATLAEFGVKGECRAGRVGVWVEREVDGRTVEEKIAAIGIRVSRWVTWHGVSLNVAPDLEHYSGIVPCGLKDYGVTSLAALGRPAAMHAVDDALQEKFQIYF